MAIDHPARREGPDPRPSLPTLRGGKSWALLARTALAERPLSPRELAGELWAEAEDPMAALRWCLADLRRGLNDAAILRGDRLKRWTPQRPTAGCRPADTAR